MTGPSRAARARPAFRLCPALLVLVLAAPEAARADEPPSVSPATKPLGFVNEVVPLLNAYCVRCHNGAQKAGGLALDAYADETAARRDVPTWDRVLRQVRSGDMPPPKAAKPSQEERDRLAHWIERQALTVTVGGRPDPGRVTLRRLNRAEYGNTLRDLFGLELRAGDDFPADEIGYGFDNIGDVLSLSPLLLEKYLTAAEKAVAAAFRSPQARARVLIAQPTRRTQDECAARILEHFARRAYRRPVAREEVERLVGLVQLAEAAGVGWEEGIQVALQAVLVSPHFLFRVELDAAPAGAGRVRPLTDYELASRLSYFLWSSLPDEELFDLAGQGRLRAGLDGQVRRMLKDPKAQALVENFAGQWLQLRSMAEHTPDPKQFAGFDEALCAAMRRETELFFQAVLREDRSILDFLDADFTFVNERLAWHYGLEDVRGSEFRRVPLVDSVRGGILTQASVLTVTSNPTRTAPVKRGKWILENILGTPPPPQPLDIADLPDEKGEQLTGTLRQRMEQHRSNPSCLSCHQRMDPLGFGLENFDGVGRWRTRDGGQLIDASGTLPGGHSFNGPAELKAFLKGRPDDFTRCLAEKLMTYALGRGMGPADRAAIEQVRQAAARQGYRLTGLILAVVQSEPFQMRREGED